MGQPAHPVREHRRRQHLAAPQQPLERREVVLRDRVEACQVGQHARHREPLGERAVADEGRRAARVDAQRRRDEVQLGARGERRVDVERRQVEVQRRVPGDAVAGASSPKWRSAQSTNASTVVVGDHHALGRAGGAGREEQVGEVGGRRRGGVGGRREQVGAREGGRRVVDRADHRERAGQLGEHLVEQGVAATRRASTSTTSGSAAPTIRATRDGRPRRVDRHVGAAGAQRPDQRRDRPRRLLREHAHPRARASGRARARTCATRFTAASSSRVGQGLVDAARARAGRRAGRRTSRAGPGGGGSCAGRRSGAGEHLAGVAEVLGRRRDVEHEHLACPARRSARPRRRRGRASRRGRGRTSGSSRTGRASRAPARRRGRPAASGPAARAAASWWCQCESRDAHRHRVGDLARAVDREALVGHAPGLVGVVAGDDAHPHAAAGRGVGVGDGVRAERLGVADRRRADRLGRGRGRRVTSRRSAPRA